MCKSSAANAAAVIAVSSKPSPAVTADDPYRDEEIEEDPEEALIPGDTLDPPLPQAEDETEGDGDRSGASVRQSKRYILRALLLLLMLLLPIESALLSVSGADIDAGTTADVDVDTDSEIEPAVAEEAASSTGID